MRRSIGSLHTNGVAEYGHPSQAILSLQPLGPELSSWLVVL
jgi:hypothetical protein